MGKTFIIAEKPSVASDIARALGGFTRQKDYFENEQYVISSAVGHLLELAVPEDQEVKRGKWTFNHLPMIPTHFDLKPIDKNKERLRLLKKWIKSKDIDLLVNACDAGREGELIFRYIAQHAGTKKPIKRLWLQSMTPTAIRDGFSHLRSDEALQPLAAAAVCRSEADWLVGINGTRAMTAFNSKMGGFQLTTVGRVQTPTLAIVVEREDKIRKFIPRNYWEVHATFLVEGGNYTGRWFQENFKRNETDPDLRPERIWKEEEAEAIRTRCLGKPGEITEESKPSTSLSPLLFDLTSLQREANGRFGFSAAMTLKVAQALYERHKVVTYPRTDARALPEDYIGTVKKTLSSMSDSNLSGYSKKILTSNWVVPNKRIFNNAKISDHFAIIPTSLAPKKLNEVEAKLYDMIARRFLAVFYPAAEYRITTRITRVEGEPFKTEGKVLVNPGWLEVYGKSVGSTSDTDLTPIQKGETAATESIDIQASETRPPARYTEATLLSAMEGAGKLVDDEELKAAMSAKGLGTPATRAAIIEGLLQEKYLVRNNKDLQPTGKGISLIALLTGLEIPELCSPELTGNWEYKLKQMEKGELQRDEFMQQIQAMTCGIVEKAKSFEGDTVPGDFGSLKVPCPKCKSEVHENYREFKCKNQACDFSIRRIMGGRQFEQEEVEKLLTEKEIGPITGFKSRMGRPFAAVIKMNDEWKVEFDFGNQDQSDGSGEAVDFSDQESLGLCPACKGKVYENSMSYVCEKSVGPEKSCTFRSGKIILQRPIERAQMTKLLETGKTELLHKFISKKGRPFSAYLVVGTENKVGFEFEPREKKKKAASKKVATKTST